MTGRAPRCTIESNSFVTMLTLMSQTDLLGVAPHQMFRASWLQQEFAVLDLGFSFPKQPTGIIWCARSAPSVIAQYAMNELRHAARQMSSPGKKLKVGLAAARSASDHGRKSGGSKT
jgi:DNA-binding transcriptional LysR family regulator